MWDEQSLFGKSHVHVKKNMLNVWLYKTSYFEAYVSTEQAAVFEEMWVTHVHPLYLAAGSISMRFRIKY